VFFVYTGPEVIKKQTGADAEIIAAIQAQVRAEMETAAELRRQNDLAEKSLVALERERAASQQRRQLAFDTNDKVSGLLPALEKAFKDIKLINRRLALKERRDERTEDILLLLLTERSPQKLAEAREDLEAEIAERETNRRKLLRQRRRNLAKLQEQAAKHGLRVPVDLANEIEAEEQAIEELNENRLNRR